MMNYDQTAEHWEALMTFAGKVLAGTAPTAVLAIKVWRRVKARWEARDEQRVVIAEKIANKTVGAAKELADVTRAQMEDVKQTVTAAAEHISSESEKTLRSLIDAHSTQLAALQSHHDAAVMFREDIRQTLRLFEGQINGIRDIVTILTKAVKL